MFQSDIEQLRTRYAKHLERLRPQGVDLGKPVVAALATVPRHLFLDNFYAYDEASTFEKPVFTTHTQDDLELIYSDVALVTELDATGNPSSSTSQPSLVALMLELAQLAPGQRVLDIGAGTGYNAALISEIVGVPSNVVSVDNQPHVVDRTRRFLSEAGYGGISVMCGDATQPMKVGQDFDRIIVTAGCADVPWHWVEHLRPGGLLLVPLQHGGPGAHPLVRLRPTSAVHMTGSVVGWSAFMALKGSASAWWPNEIPPQSADPSSRYPPLWPTNISAQSSFLDFHYYLSLIDRRTAVYGNLNFVNDESLILRSSTEHVDVWGSDAPYHDLTAAIETWRRLDQPSLTSWLTELFRKEAWQDDLAGREKGWVIDRGETLQTIYQYGNG